MNFVLRYRRWQLKWIFAHQVDLSISSSSSILNGRNLESEHTFQICLHMPSFSLLSIKLSGRLVVVMPEKLGGSIYSILDYTNTTLKIYERKLKFCMSKNIGKICSKAKFQA